MTKNGSKSKDVVPKLHKNTQMLKPVRRRASRAARAGGKQGLTRREKEGIVSLVTNCNLFNVL